jgi:hypothetical protein
MRLTALAATVAIAPGIAVAGVLDIPGNYGNAAGCRYLATHDYGDDTMLVLTPDEYMSFATGCEFLQALAAKDGSWVLSVLCSHEGEDYRSVDFMRIQRSPDVGDSFDMYEANGELIGIVGRCK